MTRSLGDWVVTHDAKSLDYAAPATVLATLRACAMGWVEDARLVGNIRAGDIVSAIEAVHRFAIDNGDNGLRLHQGKGKP